MIGLNEYWDTFSGPKSGGKIGDTGLNEILLNSMPNGCSKQKYVHGFYCETITILKAVNMFERMEIS